MCPERAYVMPADDFSSASIADLLLAGNWQHQYRLITQWGKLIQPKPAIRTAEYLIKGCELPVWLLHEYICEHHYFCFDSDSRVINGLAVLLLVQLNGKTTDELKAIDVELNLRNLGLEKHLTPSRNNGVNAIIKRCLELIEN
jgi:cysteine desulfuration protein SufE